MYDATFEFDQIIIIIIIIMNHFYKAHITIYISSLCALRRKRTEKRTV